LRRRFDDGTRFRARRIKGERVVARGAARAPSVELVAEACARLFGCMGFPRESVVGCERCRTEQWS
jgi:hypothetical protein